MPATASGRLHRRPSGSREGTRADTNLSEAVSTSALATLETSSSPGILFKNSLCPSNNFQTLEVAQARRKSRDLVNLLCVPFGDFISPSVSLPSSVKKGDGKDPGTADVGSLNPHSGFTRRAMWNRKPARAAAMCLRGWVGTARTWLCGHREGPCPSELSSFSRCKIHSEGGPNTGQLPRSTQDLPVFDLEEDGHEAERGWSPTREAAVLGTLRAWFHHCHAPPSLQRPGWLARMPDGLRAGSETLLQPFPSWDTSWHGLFEAFWIFLLPDTMLLNVDKNAFPS